MKRHKDPFTDEELARAAGLVRQSMLDRLPGPEECEHQFSPQFQEKMDPLLRKGKRRRPAFYIQRAAAVFLAVLLGGGLLLRMDPDAWSAFLRWTRDDETGKTTYYFSGDRPADELPKYRLTWIPEGHEEVFVSDEREEYAEIYQFVDDVTYGFVFAYSYMNEGSLTQIQFDEETTLIKPVTVNGCQGELYLSLDPDDPSSLIWIDEEACIMFHINSTLEESVIMRIAESVFLVD